MHQRGLVRETRRRVLAGALQIIHRTRRVAGTLVVIRNQREMRRLAAPREPRRNLAMRLALDALQHAVVRHLVQNVMLENVFAHAFEGGRLARIDQLATRQQRQNLGRFRIEHQQGFFPEHVTDDGSELERRTLLGRKGIEACLKNAGERCRHARADEPFGYDAPALCIGFDDAVVDQHLDQLFHVERIALRSPGNQFVQRRGNPVEALQQHAGEFAAVAP